MADHDASYRLLFSHKTMVADLLQGFLPPDWAAALDLDSLERLNASSVSEQLDRRDGDAIWRVRWGPSWVYVVILLEFQSSDDPDMAIRIAAYCALLYQELRRTERVGRGERLPPLLPIVLYNGPRRWTGAETVSALTATPPAGLEPYQLQARYVLIDETRLDDAQLDALTYNVAAALFRLERSPTPQGVVDVVHALRGWLSAPEQQSLRRALTVWVRRVLLPLRLPGVEIPEVDDIEELDAMLAERVVEWTEQWKQEGRLEALEGQRQMLARMVELRFDVDCRDELISLIAGLDEDTLLRVGELIVQSENASTLLSAVRALAPKK